MPVELLDTGMNDCRGNPISVGDRVEAYFVAPGAPAWATEGKVTGWGYRNLHVQWDSWDYSQGSQRYHAPAAQHVRLLPERPSGPTLGPYPTEAVPLGSGPRSVGSVGQ